MTSETKSPILLVVNANLYAALKHFYEAELGSSKVGREKETELCDFGARYRLKLTWDGVSRQRALLFVSFVGGQDVGCALPYLRELFGDSVTLLQGKTSSQYLIDIQKAVAHYKFPEVGLARLSQLRVHFLAAPVVQALERVATGCRKDVIDKGERIDVLMTHPRCGSSHCLSSAEK